MAESVTFEKGECSRNRNANMVESDSSEIQEESPRSQPHQTPNGPAAEIEERINPKLLKSIINGDLMSFKSILGIEGEPKDIESIQESNGGNSGLRGVICGENTALHVVAGVMENSSSTVTFQEHLTDLTPLTLLVFSSFFLKGLLVFSSSTSLLIHRLLQMFLFLFPIKRIRKRIVSALLHEPFPREYTFGPWGTVLRNTWQAMNNELLTVMHLIQVQPPLTTLLLKWVFPLPNVSVLHKRRMYKEIAEIIYDQDPTLLNARNNAMETPLHCAAKAGRLEMVSLLVEFARKEGPQKLEQVLWARNEVGETALHEAARSGYSGVVKELLGADENLASLVDNNGISPLYLAVTAGHVDVVEILLISPNRLTTDADHRDKFAGPDGQTALHAAVMTQEEEILRKILNCERPLAQPPARPLAEETDIAGNTPLHYAALIGNTFAVRELLLKDTGPVYKANLSGSFPVHLAAEAGNFSVIKELLSKCPDVGVLLDRGKRNFLHIAVQKKRIRVIVWACQKGIDANMINAKDKDGNTPLHLAVISSESEIFALLCQNKRVNPNIRNKEGLTPMDISEFLQDHQFPYSLNPQSIIHRALVTRGAFQNPRQPDLSKKVNDFLKARADCPNRREGREMWNGVELDIEKESAKYENMSKSLITGAVLIASVTFASIFTVSGVYRGDNTPHTLMRRNFFKAFIIVNVTAFICAIVSTIWLLYSALSNFHLKYRKFYFKRCTSLLHVAINLFILTFGLGAYIAIAPLSEWLALVILVVSGIAVIWNIIWSPTFVPLILLVPYM